ncbi:MAG TPA: hypothetical protein VGL21_07195 [Jatrophihabitantaceae bacterium]|jgi:hypothetical protein
MTPDETAELAVILRRTVDGVAAELGGAPAQVLTDERQRVDITPSGHSSVWTYLVTVPLAGDAEAVLADEVTPRLIAQGWYPTQRRDGVHFARDGFDLGVLIGRADATVGGSTPEVAA